MQHSTFASLLLVTRLCLAQRFAPYVQFEGNASGPTKLLSPGVIETIRQADTNPNASHTVRFNAQGGDWDWTLQLSDVSVPAISNSTPDAHVAFTTWHFARRNGEQPVNPKAAQVSPVCAYLMDINFPYNVSSQWDTDDSSCLPALGAKCVNALTDVTITDDCSSSNAAAWLTYNNACAGMLDGGPREYGGMTTQGLRTSSPNCLLWICRFRWLSNSSAAFNSSDVTNGTWAYALTNPYEAGNTTAFQAASERLRIMVLTGPYGSDAFCNRVSQTVEIGAEGDSDSEDGSGSGDDGDDESGATMFLPQVGGLVLCAVACGWAAYWL
jgi:hypothetical protein